MANILTAGNSSNGGTSITTDTSGTLNIVTGSGSGANAITIDASQNVVIAGGLTVTGGVSGPGVGGDYILTSYTSPATWTKPVGLKAVKVTVQGGGGNGGDATQGASPNLGSKAGGGGSGAFAVKYINSPEIPASPITITAGAGTNSFGSLVSCTGGGNAPPTGPGTTNGAGGTGGTASNATFSIPGFSGQTGAGALTTLTAAANGAGANSMNLGIGAAGVGAGMVAGNPATIGYGGGGSGGGVTAPNTINTTRLGGTGAPGIIIIEEFY